MIGRADVFGERLGGHGVADGGDFVAFFGGETFGCDVEGIFEGGLVGVKGEAVDGVDDGGHVLIPGGGASDDARFGRVGVDNIGFEISDELLGGAVALDVFERVDFADHRIDLVEFDVGVLCGLVE